MSRSSVAWLSSLLILFGIVLAMVGSPGALVISGLLIGLWAWLLWAAYATDEKEKEHINSLRDVIEQLREQKKG